MQIFPLHLKYNFQGNKMKKETVKKSINISSEIVDHIEKTIHHFPGLNFTLVVNQALEQWLQGSQKINLATINNKLVKSNSKGNPTKSIQGKK